MKVVKIDNWQTVFGSSQNKIVNRLFEVFEPVIVIDGELFLQYSGEEDKKVKVFEAYKVNKPEFDHIIKSTFGVSAVTLSKIDKVKLAWLEKLIDKFEPRNVSFSIYRHR